MNETASIGNPEDWVCSQVSKSFSRFGDFFFYRRERRNGINESRGTVGNKRVAESSIFDDRRMRYAILIERELAEKFYRRSSVLSVSRVSVLFPATNTELRISRKWSCYCVYIIYLYCVKFILSDWNQIFQYLDTHMGYPSAM